MSTELRPTERQYEADGERIRELEERLDVAEAATRDFRARMRQAQAERDTTQRSHDWWITFVGRPREAEFNRLREIETAARRFANMTHGDGAQYRALVAALAVAPVPQPDSLEDES